jgi:hypothetical protein
VAQHCSLSKDKEWEIQGKQGISGHPVGLEHGLKLGGQARHWWFMSVILATQEAEIRRITIPSQPGEIVHVTLSQKKKKKTHHQI